MLRLLQISQQHIESQLEPGNREGRGRKSLEPPQTRGRERDLRMAKRCQAEFRSGACEARARAVEGGRGAPPAAAASTRPVHERAGPTEPVRTGTMHLVIWVWGKNECPNGTPVTGNKDYNLRSPGGLILTRTARTHVNRRHLRMWVDSSTRSKVHEGYRTSYK